MEKNYYYVTNDMGDIYIGITDEYGDEYADATVNLRGQWAIESGCVAVNHNLSKKDHDEFVERFAERIMRTLPIGNFDARCTIIKLKDNWKGLCSSELSAEM